MEGKTTIAISHNLFTLIRMDRILVLENGKVIQEGPHQDLVKEEGAYREMWLKQIDKEVEQVFSS